MRTLSRSIIIPMLVLGCGLRAMSAGEMPDGDVIVARAFVPNAMLPQGEVRLLRRGRETIVQSVLHTRFGNRVKHRISGNERRNWGEHPDALAYMSALDGAFAEYEKNKDTSARDVALSIDFVDHVDASRVDFSFPPVSRDKHGFHIEAAPVWRSLDLSADYVRKNQEYILADTFNKDADELIEHLRAHQTPRENMGHE